jgi:hypothetical protein
MRGQMKSCGIYSCSVYDKQRKSNPSGCLRNSIQHRVIEACVARFLDEAGTVVDVLQDVQRTGDVSLLKTLEDRLLVAWDAYAGQFDRIAVFMRQYGRLPTVESKGNTVARLQERERQGKKNVKDMLARLYRVIRDNAAEGIKADIADLTATHKKIVRECKKLPDGSRALKDEQAALLRIEAELEAKERDLQDRTGELDHTAQQLAAIKEQIEAAKAALTGEDELRARAEAVGQIVDKIVVAFEPTGKKYPQSRPVCVTVVPKVGAAKEYRNLVSF